MKHLIITIFIFNILLFSNILAAKEDQIKIESDKLFVSQNPSRSIFTGNVYAFDDEIKIWSDKMTITFFGPNNKIDTIEGEGNVKLIREKEEINADYVFYNLRKATIKAQENIIVKQGENIIIGDQLDVDLQNATSIIKSTKTNRVTAVISIENE